jgi:hypothetical protein
MSENVSAITTSTATGDWTYIDASSTWYQEPLQITTPSIYAPVEQGEVKIKKGGDDDMRYLYEVILVNPKNEAFDVLKVVAKNETSAMMKAYNNSAFEGEVEFDELKTSCRVLMEWKKEKSLEKAIKMIKEATE